MGLSDIAKNTKRALPDVFSGTTLSNEQASKIKIVNACFLGHVDAGKSTTVSRILLDSGAIDSHTIEQYRKEAAAMGKESFCLAWVLDKAAEQRKRGITIECAHAEFTTNSRYYTIIDAPGHSNFTSNAIVGASQADLIILTVDAKKGLLEQKQTEQHATIARASGINSVVVALTKVDTIPKQMRESVIKERMGEVSNLLKSCGFAPDRTIMVPIDSYNGMNISNKQNVEAQIPWYNGPTLFEALDTVPIDLPDSTLPFRMSVEHVCTKIGGTNCVATGKIMSGTLRPNDKVWLKPSFVQGCARSIQMHFKPMNFATAGCNVGIDLKGIQEKDCPKGTILCHIDDRPVKSVKEFTVEKAVIRTHPTVLAKGSNIIVHYQTASVCAKIKKLSNAFDISTRTMTPGEVQSVKPGTVVDIVFEPEKAIPIETKSTHPRNCKIMLRDFNCTVGWGSVSDVKISDFEI